MKLITATAADMVSAAVEKGRETCRPSKNQPEKPSSWCRARINVSYAHEFMVTPQIRVMVIDAASAILAEENGQIVDITAPSEDEIDRKISAINASRDKKAESAAQAKQTAQAERESKRVAEQKAREDRWAAERRATEAARQAQLDSMVPVHGDTYPVRDQLKSQCNARWNPNKRVWLVKPEMKSAADAIVRANEEAVNSNLDAQLAAAGLRPIAQLWEKCRCGAEPVYQWNDGRTCCKKCALEFNTFAEKEVY